MRLIDWCRKLIAQWRRKLPALPSPEPRPEPVRVCLSEAAPGAPLPEGASNEHPIAPLGIPSTACIGMALLADAATEQAALGEEMPEEKEIRLGTATIEAQQATPSPIKPNQSRVSRTDDDSAPWAQFYFKDAILDQLDHYMRYLARMRRHDRDAFDLYSRTGALISPRRGNGWDIAELSPWFRQARPSFGATAWCDPENEETDEREKRITPKFVYFTKFQKPSAKIQAVNSGDVYLVTAFFDRLERRDLPDGFMFEFAVVVLPDGTIGPLRIMMNDTQTLRHRRGEYRSSTITHQRWGLPPAIVGWAEEHNVAPAEHMRRIFTLAANAHEQMNASMIRIHAKRNNLTAVFCVDYRRLPYFFRDRTVMVAAAGGRRRPIFHVVRPHQRRLADGRLLPIKMHFSGLREFQWNGYEIFVSVPGLHHANIAEFKPGVLNFDDEEMIPDGLMDLSQMGEFFADHIRKGFDRRVH